MEPVRSPGPAGPLADTFLDATHGPFVHAATIGAPDQAEVEPAPVTTEPGGFSSVQEQWCDNPVDPEVATGGRPLRQRRRTTYTYRAPFQLRLRQEFLDSGATTTILYLLQPEDLDSTRIYVCLLLSSGPGQPLHTPAEVAAQLALQKQILEEDVRSQAALAAPGLPLDLRDEVHVPADRLGRRAAAGARATSWPSAAGRRRPRSSVVRQLRPAGRAAGRRVLVGQPPARRADPARPAGGVAALVPSGRSVRSRHPRPTRSSAAGTRGPDPPRALPRDCLVPPQGVTFGRIPPARTASAGTLGPCRPAHCSAVPP